MRRILILSFMALSNVFLIFGQVDTLYEEDLRKVGDILFQNLNQNLYGKSLFDRTFSIKKTTNEQVNGNYNQIHDITTYFELYEDIVLSYVDSTTIPTFEQTYNYIDSCFSKYEKLAFQNRVEELRQPFALVLHDMKRIDTSYLDPNNFSYIDFHLNPLINESNIYSSVQVKGAALLEFYPDNGYPEGLIVFEPGLISTSENITGLKLKLSSGLGFEDFNNEHPLFAYNRNQDSTIGFVAIEYSKNNIIIYDTLSFYLTTKGVGNQANKSSSNWDYTEYYTGQYNIDFRIAVKRGCNNSGKSLRRPLIMIPPYRPTVQNPSMDTYYDQFNYWSTISSLAAMGYDVLFIKLLPGNESLETAAITLSEYIDKINVKKHEDYPNEDNENILMGYSMGGQIARYALMYMEKNHMYALTDKHHHTRLYIPFDSPHHGANIPFHSQVVYKDYKNYYFFAYMAYQSLTDEASKDMSFNNVISSTFNHSGWITQPIWTINPYPPAEAVNFRNSLSNDFLHSYSHPSDERRSFPSFTRNIGISTGNLDMDYNTQFGLLPGKLLFEQLGWVGEHQQLRYRKLYASHYGSFSRLFYDRVIAFALGFPIVLKNKDYYTINALDFDLAAGGYKDEFYDKMGLGFIPLGAVSILRATGGLMGFKYYNEHMSFMPTFSSLAINKNIWQNNNLFYDLKGNGLMYKYFNSSAYSDTYGYPNLGRPTDHFQITPFEAIYCDPQTYEHIKMQASVDDDNLDNNYLRYTRNFILDEVEADIVCLQNKTIGKNHISNPNYKYRAWYKAYDQIWIGNLVTPKTDPGDYIIEKTGDITVKAQNSISIKPGFHAQAGSDFHAFIGYDGCSRPRSEP